MNPNGTIPSTEDAFGAAMLDAVDGKLDHPIVIERDDGFVDAHSAAVYLTPFNEWQPGLRKAMRHVRGKILDIGAGAGRISLYLQDRGFDVTAMDNSPQAIEACRRRGVRQTAVTDVAHVAELGEFDTILLLGGNLSLLGSPSRARRLLRVFLKASTPRGRIIAQGLDLMSALIQYTVITMPRTERLVVWADRSEYGSVIGQPVQTGYD